jgi:transaldolase
MKFFADTANMEDIEYSFLRNVSDGITTNPKIIESTGDLSQGFEGVLRGILNQYKNVPVSLETDLQGIDVENLDNVDPTKVRDILLEQAYYLNGLGNNVVVKIPICEGGLLATKELYEKGIKTNVTACMTPYQAMRAADAGATYVSLFANRMLDSNILELSGHSLDEILENPIWKEILKSNKEEYFDSAWNKTLEDISYVASQLDNRESDLIVGSIRSPEDIYKLVKAGPQVITIPTKIVRGLENIPGLKNTQRSIIGKETQQKETLFHPMTQYTIEEFEESAKAYKSLK